MQVQSPMTPLEMGKKKLDDCMVEMWILNVLIFIPIYNWISAWII